MKKHNTIKLVLVLTVMLMCFIPMTAHALTEQMSGWQDAAGNDAVIDTDTVYQGSDASIKVVNNDYTCSCVTRTFEVNPNSHYKVSVMAKSSNYSLSSGAAGEGGAKLGIPDGYLPGTPCYSGTEWRKLSYTFDTDADQTEFTVALWNGIWGADCKGTAYFSQFVFEETEEDKWDGTYTWNAGSDAYIDHDVAYTGCDYSIAIENTGYNSFGVYKNIPVKKNTIYRASVYVKYKGYESGPNSKASGGGICSYDDLYNRAEVYNKSTTWKKVEIEFYSGNKTSYPVMLQNGFGGGECKGTAYFSNFKVTEINPVESCTLIYGSETFKDKNAFVITIMGDGYTKSQQAKFLKDAKAFKDELLKCKPWNELKSGLKIYAVGVSSKQSGARGDKAATYSEALKDTRDTYFSSAFWTSKIERLLVVNNTKRVQLIIDSTKPETDAPVVLVNSPKYGGSGGWVSVASTGAGSSDVAFHEMGHSIAGLADEYNYGEGDTIVEGSPLNEAPNKTNEKDKTKVKWKSFIGSNGIGLSLLDGTKSVYIPSYKCKMRNIEADFCEVCKEQIRKSVCKKTTRTIIYYQPYNRKPRIGSSKFDIRPYMKLRKGTKTISGKDVKSLMTVTYYNSSNVKMSGAPKKAGTYYAKVSFKGNDTYGACSQKFKFKIYS